MSLVICTLTWNGLDHLTKLKQSLLPALDKVRDWSWWIKSNGCTDGTIEEVSTWGDKVNLIAYKDNLQNFSQGCNYLFNAASPKDNDLVLLLNNDIVFQDISSLTNMIAMLKDDIGVVGTKLLYPDQKRIQHAGVVFTPKYGLPINYRSGELPDDKASKNREFQAITGAVALMKAETYRNIYTNKDGSKGLDTEYIWSFEDVDMCLASCLNMKKKVIYCGETDITHEESASLKKNAMNKLFLNKNAHYFLDKWKGRYKIDIDNYNQDAEHNLL